MKTLVTGGAGFIGSHLVDLLLKEGHQVTVIDNFSTGTPKNLEHLSEDKSFHFVEADVSDHASIKDCFKDIDWVFHLAALADIVPSIQNPLNYCNSNVSGTTSCLEAARNAGVSRFVYAASSSCYGIPDEYPTKESAPIRPMYPYALSKYLGEEAALHWGQVYDLPVVSLRFFNVYGPRARTTGTYGAVFGVFLAQKLNGKPYTIVGDGTQTRDFTFVTDVANAVYAAARSSIAQEIINIGSNSTQSINRLVELLGGETTNIPKRAGEPDCTYADISKALQLLDWEPKVSFEEGVAIMLEHLDDWREAPVWTTDKIAEATKDWHKYMG